MTTVRADRDQLFRVLANLANNAAAVGATTLTIRREPGNGRFRLPSAMMSRGPPRGCETNYLSHSMFRPRKTVSIWAWPLHKPKAVA